MNQKKKPTNSARKSNDTVKDTLQSARDKNPTAQGGAMNSGVTPTDDDDGSKTERQPNSENLKHVNQQDQIEIGQESNAKDKLKSELKSFFKPEFLNRLTEIIFFEEFDKSSIDKISKLELNAIVQKLNHKNIEMSFTPGVIKYISELAIKEKMGARPIKRIIQKNIENILSNLILDESIVSGSKIKFKALRGALKYDIKEE